MSATIPDNLREVTQTRTGVGRGNCTEAVFASLLDVPLGDVPDLWGGPGSTEDDQRRPGCWGDLAQWLRSDHGRVWLKLTFDPAEVGRFDRRRWFADEPEAAALPWGAPHGLAGRNPDGDPHVVVAVEGRMVWDPNPRRRGLVSVDEAWFLLPTSSLPEGQRDWPGIEIDLREVQP